MAQSTSLMERVRNGAIAGAVGTCALDVATYLDVAVRGRPPSSMPSEAAGRLADAAHVSLGAEKKTAENRKTGIGALLGYADGIATGAAFALLARRPRFAVAAVVLGAGAMLASDVPATVSGMTNPKEWGLSGWLSDLVPHLVYGAAAAYAYDRLQSSSS
jgi:hypothetical protein